MGSPLEEAVCVFSSSTNMAANTIALLQINLLIFYFKCLIKVSFKHLWSNVVNLHRSSLTDNTFCFFNRTISNHNNCNIFSYYCSKGVRPQCLSMYDVCVVSLSISVRKHLYLSSFPLISDLICACYLEHLTVLYFVRAAE